MMVRGSVIISKRLESGVFTKINPMYREEIVLTEAEFGLFFEGANLEKRFVESPIEIRKSSLPIKQELHKIQLDSSLHFFDESRASF